MAIVLFVGFEDLIITEIPVILPAWFQLVDAVLVGDKGPVLNAIGRQIGDACLPASGLLKRLCQILVVAIRHKLPAIFCGSGRHQGRAGQFIRLLGLVATLLLHLALYHNVDGKRPQVGFVFVAYPQFFN